MLDKQIYTETGFITENDLESCINERRSVSARVVEYDRGTKMFTVRICDNIKGVLYNESLSANTAASFVGRAIKISVSNVKDKEGFYVCNFENRDVVFNQYEQNKRVICRVNAILGYGAMLGEVETGATALLHIREIQKRFDVNHASEIMAVGDYVEVYMIKTDNGIQYSFEKSDSESNTTMTCKFFSYLKSKIA